jgi:predicted RecB family nuclease
MATKITRDVLEGYLNCKYKGHLKLVGQQGTKSDYENLLTERRADVRLAAFDKILAQNPTEEVVRNVTLTTSVLKRAPLFILDGTLEDDLFSLDFDGLKKVDGPSKLGGFHYVPMLFFEGTKIGKPQRLLLEIQGLLLSRIQNRTPAVGIVWLGEECRASNMRLGSDQRAIERLLRELREMAASESTPSLILNDHCSVCEFRQQCHAQAVKEDNLSLMRGMNEKTMTHQNSKGIFTVTQLSYTFRTRRKSKRIKHPSTPHHFPLQALAIRENKVFVHGSPAFSPCPTRVYIDFEGDPEQRAYYLIGLIAVENGLQTRHSYWADSECDQVQIFRQLMDYLERYADYSLLHFGSYEVNALRRMKAHMPASYHQPIENAVQRSINVLSFIHPHIYFPAYSNSLKDLGHYLGCTWSAPSSSGIQSLVWRRQWLRSRDDGLKSELTRYNIEDCMALRKVAEFVERIAAGRPGSEGPGEPLPIVFTNTLPTKADHRHVFKKAVFALDDFALVNRCAYFDYQRDKVFARSCDGVRRANRSKKHRRSPSHRISKCVELHLGRCPSCTSRWIKPLRALHRLTVDLRFTSSGVRRWVVRYDSWRYRCSKCEGTFTPGAFPSNKAKYGRGLISWCIYHHFARGQNMRQVAEALPDLFGLHSSRVPVDRFKIAVAEFYQAYYEALRDEILAGHLLHIDETEVALRGKKGYVWVIASMSAAYYFYRDSREGHFLQENAESFQGCACFRFLYGLRLR